MSVTGFPTFDHTIQETHVWLHGISSEMRDPRPKIAYHALRGVLFALRDRLMIEEVFDFSAQLPLLVRGIFFEGYQPAGKPEKYHKAEFLERVSEELQKAGRANPETATRAVFKVLEQQVSEGEIANIRDGLPGDFQGLWSEVVTA